MFNYHKNVKTLVLSASLGFLFLSMIVAVIPAQEMQKAEPLPGMEPLTESENRGLHVFVAENCVACHTQQVRNIEMDKVWGDRPSVPSDYYYTKKRLDFWRQSPSVLGSERTGPDLTNVGNRRPGQTWHLLHMYNPRIVEPASIMPSYPWLFTAKDSAAVLETDVVVPLPVENLPFPGAVVVAKPEMVDLIAYLNVLKQVPMPGTATADFIPAKEKAPAAPASSTASTSGSETAPALPEADIASLLPDGEKLYTQHCGACHQASGKGIIGAFPPLAGSSIVNTDDPDLMVRIILQGYDARSEFGVMPGFADKLSDEEIAAIANHERSSWGNTARKITAEEVKAIRNLVMQDL